LTLQAIGFFEQYFLTRCWLSVWPERERKEKVNKEKREKMKEREITSYTLQTDFVLFFFPFLILKKLRVNYTLPVVRPI
jgi:hypothetical protein